MIDFEFLDVEIPGFDSEFFMSSLESLIVLENYKSGEITIVFCTDDYLLEINKTYLNHDFYTDIITFDYSENGVISGDLFISVDRVNDNAGSFSVSVDNELKRVIYHGVLHLCGYKDKTENDENEMREKENFYINQFVSRETN
ncbi:MAG: rRNA maturation RNase YbeY [Crocinitomicaceae bacterium]